MKTFWLLSILSFSIFAQSNNEYLVIPKIKIGATFPGYTSYVFTDNPSINGQTNNPFSIKPGLSYGVGLESPILLSFYETNLTLSVEIAYGESTTGDVETYYGNSKYTVTSLPILVWAKIKTNGKIVPFVSIGIGTERTEMIEKYELKEESNFKLSEWFFSWGIGAGLDINMFNNYAISLFVDSIIKEGGIAKQFDDGRAFNYDTRNGMFFCGIQFGYKI